jgi:hypothetical protein
MGPPIISVEMAGFAVVKIHCKFKLLYIFDKRFNV